MKALTKTSTTSTTLRAFLVLGVMALVASACTSPAGTGDDDAVATTESTLQSGAAGTTAAAEGVDDPELLAGMVVTSGGASDTFKRVQFDIGTTTVTSATPESFIEGVPVSDDGQQWLIVELGVEALGSLGWQLGSVWLADAAGELQVEGEMYGHLGDSIREFRFVGRDSWQTHVAFAIDEVPADLSSWAVHVGDDEDIPLFLPIDGPAFSRSYPLPLPHGEFSLVSTGTFNRCDGVEMPTLVDSVTVGLERDAEPLRDRSDPGFRIVQIELAITNSVSDNDCGNISLWPDFFLLADGVRADEFLYVGGRVDPGATVVLDLGYEILASTERLELIGGADERVLASWEISLPVANGEAGLPTNRMPAMEPLPVLAFGPSPDGITEMVNATGGATGSILGTQFSVGTSLATNASFSSIESGSPVRDSDGRTHVVVDLAVQGLEEREWRLGLSQVVLEDPNGRPVAVSEVLTTSGEVFSDLAFDGRGSDDLRFIFETPGFVTDLNGWTVVLEPEGRLALRLPLSGDVLDELPRPLTVGASRNISVGPFSGCTDTGGDEANVTIEQAALTAERRSALDELARISPGIRNLQIDMALTSLVEPAADFSTQICGSVGLWPPFLVRADGRFLQTAPRVEITSIDYGATEVIRIDIEIPEETQSIELYAGNDPTLIVGWQLLDNGQVLEDFEADKSAGETLVTLDESVLFAFGSSELSDAAVAPLTRLANVLNEDSTGEITITGHTDSIGDDASNELLSFDRAEAVVAFLADAGVGPERLIAIGAGESNPVAPNENDDGSDNPIGRALNRRVEVLFATP